MTRQAQALFRTLVVVLSLTLLIVESSAARNPSAYRGEIKRYLKAAEKAWNLRGAVLVASRGKPVLQEGFGMACDRFQQENLPSTKFFIGSITKQFTAAAILLLQERQLLHVSDPITRHLPDYPADPGDRITIHHLLTHTSGLPNFTEKPVFLASRTYNLKPEELMTLFVDEELDFAPGTRFRYSNSGYVVLGAIIEAASGQSYEAFLHHELFDPSGMSSTGYGRKEAGVPERADGYTIDEKFRTISAIPIDYSSLYSAGALYSTVGDMLLWERALFGPKQILSEHSVEAMTTDHGYGYGYGLYVDSLYSRPQVFHGGFVDGFNSVMMVMPEDELVALVFANEDETPVRKICRGIISTCLFGRPYVWPEKKKERKMREKNPSSLEGIYQPGAGLPHLVTAEGDSLYIQLPGRSRDRLVPEKRDRYFLQTDNTISVTFERDDHRIVTGYTLWDEGVEVRAMRLEGKQARHQFQLLRAVPLVPSEHGQVAGVYTLESPLSTDAHSLLLEVVLEGNRLYASVAGFRRISIVPMSSLEFFHRTADFRIVFEKDSLGVISKCRLCLGDECVTGMRNP